MSDDDLPKLDPTKSSREMDKRAEEPMSEQPGHRLAVADDYIKMSTSSLQARKADLLERIGASTRQTEVYKKRVGRLAAQLQEQREPAQKMSHTVTRIRDNIHHQIVMNQRHKDAVFNSIRMTIDEQQDRVKSVEDQAGEARRQLTEAQKYLEYVREKRMGTQQRLIRQCYSLLDYIRSFFPFQ